MPVDGPNKVSCRNRVTLPCSFGHTLPLMDAFSGTWFFEGELHWFSWKALASPKTVFILHELQFWIHGP